MSINHLILRNFKKNIRNYYLYVFALIFSVALYFAFVTLQFDPSMDETRGSVKGAASIKAASVLLVGIVSVFLLYANNIFIKRRSKEIGLFQLIGMTKGKIFRLLTAENFLLYFSSLLAGIAIGFSISKLILMVLFKVTGVEAIATLQFSPQALVQTLLIFAIIYILIMAMNYIFIKRQSILSLFRVKSKSEERVRRVSLLEMLVGILGIILIITGYYVSSKLFGGAFVTINELFIAMVLILGSVILGTYLFYKGSITFIANMMRKSKDGYLNINEVLSLSSIMFRMKSNALLLTIITTVSALAIGLLSLSYISYYSAEKNGKENVPTHFSLSVLEEANDFKKALDAHNISYDEITLEVIQIHANIEDIMHLKMEEMNYDPSLMQLAAISAAHTEYADIAPDEVLLTGYSSMLNQFLSLQDSGQIQLKGLHEEIPLTYLGPKDENLVPYTYTAGGLPTVVVHETVFERLKADVNPELQRASSLFIGINIESSADLKKANELFNDRTYMGSSLSQQDLILGQKMIYGLTMFIVGFLGLTFLVTSGCILYFKQMDESEDEKDSYTILRKLGFTQGDLLKGIQGKQLFSFGIPLLLGLLHSYFAVKSGWFFFGSELWTPMIIVMVLYTALYSIFGFLSVLYYKKIIKEAL